MGVFGRGTWEALPPTPTGRGDKGKCVPSGDGRKRVPSGDGGKCVPSGHLREAQNDPKSSTETSVGYGSSLHED